MQQEKVILKKVCTCSGFCLCLYELRCFLLLVIEGYMFDCCALARTPYIMCCCPLPLNYLDSYISCLPNSFLFLHGYNFVYCQGPKRVCGTDTAFFVLQQGRTCQQNFSVLLVLAQRALTAAFLQEDVWLKAEYIT